MRNTAITQVALIIISVVIIIAYIRPTFAGIRLVQDETYQYAVATANANNYNDRLNQLLALERGFSISDIRALETFLPTDIDSLAVMQDLETLVTESGGQLTVLESSERTEPNLDVEFDDYFDEQSVTANRFVTQEFSLSFISDYENFTGFLRDLEKLGYIAEVKNLTFGEVSGDDEEAGAPTGGGLNEFSMTVKVYAMVDFKKAATVPQTE